MRVGIVVPTLNAGLVWAEWISQLKLALKDIKDCRVLVIDSMSDDATATLSRQAGLEVHTISRSEFDHGRTRQLAAELLFDCEIIVYLTQDAVIASHDSITTLLEEFKNDSVGMVYGRQLPHINAKPIGMHARLYNYPPRSQVRSISDIPRLGIRAAFASNSFCAYRRQTLITAGGFPSKTIFGEDMIVAARMLIAGWKVVYKANAEVRHSHDYSLVQEFRRYFDIGVLHSKESWLLEKFGKPEGEGVRFVLSELRFLLKKSPWLIPSALLRLALKLMSYKLGKNQKYLPLCFVRLFSMNKPYWK